MTSRTAVPATAVRLGPHAAACDLPLDPFDLWLWVAAAYRDWGAAAALPEHHTGLPERLFSGRGPTQPHPDRPIGVWTTTSGL